VHQRHAKSPDANNPAKHAPFKRAFSPPLTLVALNILWAGYGMLRESVGGLMDEVADPEAVADLRRVISEHADGAIEAHDVRTRTAGRVTFVEFHLIVPGRMTVEDSHVICDRIEQAIRDRAGTAVINIHVEPERKAKHKGVPVL